MEEVCLAMGRGKKEGENKGGGEGRERGGT